MSLSCLCTAWSCWWADLPDLLILLIHWFCWWADPADAPILLMWWCADVLILLMCWSCWCADPSDVLILLFHWSSWSCWCADPADVLFLLIRWSFWLADPADAHPPTPFAHFPPWGSTTIIQDQVCLRWIMKYLGLQVFQKRGWQSESSQGIKGKLSNPVRFCQNLSVMKVILRVVILMWFAGLNS